MKVHSLHAVIPVSQHCSSTQTVWTAPGLNHLRPPHCNTTSRSCHHTHGSFKGQLATNVSLHYSGTENYSRVSVNYCGLQKTRPTASININSSEAVNNLTWYCFRTPLPRCQHPPRPPCCWINVNNGDAGRRRSSAGKQRAALLTATPCGRMYVRSHRRLIIFLNDWAL